MFDELRVTQKLTQPSTRQPLTKSGYQTSHFQKSIILDHDAFLHSGMQQQRSKLAAARRPNLLPPAQSCGWRYLRTSNKLLRVSVQGAAGSVVGSGFAYWASSAARAWFRVRRIQSDA
jgi:hypothetical protein